MFPKYLKSIILILGYLCSVQSKECYSCVGINCLRTSKVTNKASCIDPIDDCVTVFEGLTVIARGCYSTLPEEHRRKCDNINGSDCHKCFKSLCNDKGPISCLQCNSENNKECYSGMSKVELTRCPVSSSPNSYCYTRKSSDKIERGCLTDTNEQLKCLTDSSCEMCIAGDEDTCNRESADDIGSGCEHISINNLLSFAIFLILILL